MDPASGLPAGAVGVPVDAAEAARPAWWPRQAIARVAVPVAWAGAAGADGARRAAWAAALCVLGCAAAGLALFAMSLPAADLGDCADVADDLRTASQRLLLAASAQVLAATLGVLVPARLFAVFAYLVGSFAADPATDVLWMLVACHDSAVHGELSSYYRFVRFLLWAALAVGTLVSLW